MMSALLVILFKSLPQDLLLPLLPMPEPTSNMMYQLPASPRAANACSG